MVAKSTLAKPATSDDDDLTPSHREQLLTVPETADALRLSQRAVWRFIAGGRLPSVRLGRAVRVDQADLSALIESLKRTPT